MNSILEDILIHYGMPRRSGRYPWGSGDDPYQHSGDFLSRVQELKKTGMSETDIAKNIGLTTTQLRTQISLAKERVFLVILQWMRLVLIKQMLIDYLGLTFMVIRLW